MTKLEINLQKLIDKEGFDDAKSMLGLTTIELIQKSNCRIDFNMANGILGYLFREKLFPWTYKNCQLSYDGFGGIINWECDWSGDFFDDYNEEYFEELIKKMTDINANKSDKDKKMICIIADDVVCDTNLHNS